MRCESSSGVALAHVQCGPNLGARKQEGCGGRAVSVGLIFEWWSGTCAFARSWGCLCERLHRDCPLFLRIQTQAWWQDNMPLDGRNGCCLKLPEATKNEGGQGRTLSARSAMLSQFCAVGASSKNSGRRPRSTTSVPCNIRFSLTSIFNALSMAFRSWSRVSACISGVR